MLTNNSKVNDQVHLKALFDFALPSSDADQMSLVNVFPLASLEFPPRTISAELVNVEALTMQVLEELAEGFPEFDCSETLDADCFEPIPIAPSLCPSSSTPIKEQHKRGFEGNQPEEPFKKQRCVSPSDFSFEDPMPTRFRDYQAEQWTEKFEELCVFVKKDGHCQVPHGYPENKSLARWTKRQRYQYKLKSEGKSSTMTDDRITALNALRFVWNSHGAVWEERLNELRQYHRLHGHGNVPSQFDENQKLATWVKCQRRQYKLFVSGHRSNMTVDRVNRLQKLGFVWEIRCHAPR
jgi:hypothetical protein